MCQDIDQSSKALLCLVTFGAYCPGFNGLFSLLLPASLLVDDKPKLECVAQKPPSPGMGLPELLPEKRDPDLPLAASVEPIFPSMATTSVGSHGQPASVGEPAAPTPAPVPSPPPAPELPEPLGSLPELVPVMPAVNGLTDRDDDLDLRSSELAVSPALPQDQPPPEAPSPRADPVETRGEGVAISASPAAPPAAAVLPATPTTAVAATCTAAAPPPPPGLLPPAQAEPPSVVMETSQTDMALNDKMDPVQLPNSRKSPTTGVYRAALDGCFRKHCLRNVPSRGCLFRCPACRPITYAGMLSKSKSKCTLFCNICLLFSC